MGRIETDEDVAAALARLVARDPRLSAVRAAAGHVPLRRTAPGFASLASIIVGQQVSRASADAINARLVAIVGPVTAAAIGAASDADLRMAGLSRPKQRALRAAAAAERDGLDLAGLCDDEAETALACLLEIAGIGPWTAQVYLLVAAGHADIFPAGDVALQTAVGSAFGLAPRPDARMLAGIAESWSPWRSVAARLFWSYYREMRGRDAAPVPIE